MGPVGEGGSRAWVFRLRKQGVEGLILKVQRVAEDPDPAAHLSREAGASRWGLGPQVKAYLAQGGYEYLLLKELPGPPASEVLPEGRKEAVARLARTLRQPTPYPSRPAPLTGALRWLELGLVGEEDVDEERRGLKAEALFQELLKARPLGEELVVAHGDFCLDNVLLWGEGVFFVDLGRLGVADRCQDLALMVQILWAWGRGGWRRSSRPTAFWGPIGGRWPFITFWTSFSNGA
ncbi:phosphotransferase [Thermus sp.]|uniref:phosphotransferase n=1 Tax=Thermus sp. TaxID=275 RepID=UPI00307DFE02